MVSSSSPKKFKWITVRFILALILFLGILFAFVAIADEIVLEHENGFDQSISKSISSIVSPSLTRLMQTATFFGSSNFLFPAYIVLIVFYFSRKQMRLVLDIIMVGLTSTSILYLFKEIFKRQRPLDPLIQNVTGFSFPSGHSFSSFTFFGLIIYILWKADIRRSWKLMVSAILFLIASTIAFSRVYLRVHYPSDVVAGFCLSVIWLMLSVWVLHLIDKKNSSSSTKAR